MKKSFIIFILSICILFIACGKGGESSFETPPVDTSINMVTNKIYTIRQGQTLTKTSEPTEIVVEIDTNTNITTAVLKSGSAQIISE
jgi:hypothetical protein